uniref:Uncharacterized protein n=1 Tax=Salix viminalis TaxID=40686 RepID=A0A6N2NHB8_SALVM
MSLLIKECFQILVAMLLDITPQAHHTLHKVILNHIHNRDTHRQVILPLVATHHWATLSQEDTLLTLATLLTAWTCYGGAVSCSCCSCLRGPPIVPWRLWSWRLWPWRLWTWRLWSSGYPPPGGYPPRGGYPPHGGYPSPGGYHPVAYPPGGYPGPSALHNSGPM